MLLPLIFASIVVFSFLVFSANIRSRERRLCEGAAVHAASHVSASIGAVIRTAGRLASALQANPTLQSPELSRIASTVLDLGDFVTGVSVAPNAVVKYHFPESGDQSSIGHDLLSNPERRDALARAMESGQPILSGPEDSMDGGQSAFLRFPVFQAGKIWGFVSVTLDFGRLMDEFSAAGKFPGIAFAVAVRDEVSGEKTWYLAAGVKAAYDARGVFAPVVLPGTEWHIYAMPNQGWSSSDPYLYVLFIAGLTGAALLFLSVGKRTPGHENVARQKPEHVVREQVRLEPKPSELPVLPAAESRIVHKPKKEVRFKGQNVKGELYMPDVLLSGDPDSLFRLPEAFPAKADESAKPEPPPAQTPTVQTPAIAQTSAAAPAPAATPVPTPARPRQSLPKQEPLFTLDEETERKTPSILVVDDSEANRDIMGRMLSLRGYSADFAASGEEALSKAESRDYDIVFMDCFMPVMDGYQASAALRSRFPGSRMRIIGISARIGDQEAARCASAGMDALLAKPFTLKELQATLEKHA